MRYLIRYVLMCCILFSSAGAQSNERDQARMAQAYERSGDLRNAARLYQELYALSPQNEMYFGGVVRTLQALDQTAGLYPVVVTHAKRIRNVETYILAGSLAAKLGKPAERDEHWQQVRDISGGEESTLVLLGKAQAQAFLFKEALKTFLDARKQNGSGNAYSDEIVLCLVSTGGYGQAIQEILSDYADEQELPLIVKRLNVVLANEGTAKLLEDQILSMDQTGPILRLALWFYRQQKSWDKALRVAIQLDKSSNSPGSELLSYADGARADDQFDAAIDGYRRVMERTADQRLQTSAAYGAVRALEQKLRSSTSMRAEDARAVVEAYDDVIRRFGQHPLAADALYYSALILDDVLHELDDAQRRLLRLTSFWKGASVTTDAAMRLADIYLSQDLDSSARQQLQIVLDMRGVNEKTDLARLRLADLQLWSGNDTAALALYGQIAENTGSIAANDAIDRSLLLQLRQDDSTAVAAIIKAEELIVRRRFNAAVELLASKLATVRDNDLKDRGAFLAAKASAASGDTLRAEPFLLSILEHVPESIFGDQALWLLATVSERKNDVKSAMQYLESLLVYYPRSILTSDARERIRRLRGDA